MRRSGVLLHISSLPSKYGIGTLGKCAHDFAEFLSQSGCSVWQLLPLGPTGCGDSPYQSFSSFAGNPYFVDIDYLINCELLTEDECVGFDFGPDRSSVDYGALYENRLKLLSLALPRFIKNTPHDYDDFCKSNSWWLDDYAVFATLKSIRPDIPWQEWDDGLKHRDESAIEAVKSKYDDKIQLHKMIQYLFRTQWNSLKKHCGELGIALIGDLPIYTSSDSSDVWTYPHCFELDNDLYPKLVAGCPPDGFTPNGQLWGNPVYSWDGVFSDGGIFWKERLRTAMSMFDLVRIDHFRGFESFYAIPAGEDTAAHGRWIKGPGKTFFDIMRAEFDELPLIAEDLGFITDPVKDLLRYTAFPGMKVLQFGFFSGAEEHLPHNYPTNCVAYTGTHDNPTTKDFFDTLSQGEKNFAFEYLEAKNSKEAVSRSVRCLWASAAEYTVIPMQDLLFLGKEGRMNTPSTIGGNWKWRMKDLPDDTVSENLKKLNRLYQRN